MNWQVNKLETCNLIQNCKKFKPSCNHHDWDSKRVTAVDRWSLFRGNFDNKMLAAKPKYDGC